MSEYQYVEFRAVDRPLTDAELEFANQLSTRAEISRWSFRNEYHYSDFRGNSTEMLRRGYDVYLHYANYGTRTAAFRLPAGLPFSKAVWSRYIGSGDLEPTWERDPKGKAGILSLSPSHDPGGIDEIWNPSEYTDGLITIRNRLVGGDQRALYAMWLCAAFDEQSFEPDIVEPPVPGGLADCVDELAPFMDFFGVDPLILAAAAEGAPDAPPQPSRDQRCHEWVDGLSEADSKQLLRRFLTEDASTIKAETVATIQQATGSSDWPTLALGRALETLLNRTEQLRREHEANERKKREAAERREAKKQERERQERMKQMVAEPQAWLREATKLTDERGTANYKAAAAILADLREAIGGDEGEKLSRKHAAHLAKRHPTLNHLKSSLRKRGLLE